MLKMCDVESQILNFQAIYVLRKRHKDEYHHQFINYQNRQLLIPLPKMNILLKNIKSEECVDGAHYIYGQFGHESYSKNINME